MPINLPNFLNAPLSESPLSRILPGFIEGYKAQRLPTQMRQEEEQRRLANAFAQFQNQYYPQLKQQELDKGNIDIQTGRLNLEALPTDISARQNKELIANLEAARKRELGLKYDERDIQAKLAEQDLINRIKNYELMSAPEKRELENDVLRARISMNLAKANQASQAPSTEIGKHLAKKDAEQYDRSVSAIDASTNLQDTLDRINNIVLTQPELFKNAVGPFDRFTTSLMGLPETRALANELKVYGADLQLKTARLEKGATSDKERAFIEDIKPNPKDNVSAYMGKLKALNNINKQLIKRNHLIAEKIRNNIPSHIAIKEASQETPLLPENNAWKVVK